MKKKVIQIVFLLATVFLIMPHTVIANIYYDESDNLSFTVNGVTLPASGYEPGKPWDNCWTFANIIYEKIWGVDDGDDLLRNIRSDDSLSITEANTRKYIMAAEQGANIRVEDRRGEYEHSMILVQKDFEGFTVYHGNFNGKIYFTYYTYSEFAMDFADYKYFAYILYPGAPAYKTTANGTFGSGLKWEMDNTGLLTISGDGDMPDFQNGNAPWSSYRQSIKYAAVCNEITNVPNYAFKNCGRLESVSLTDSVTSIGDYAFENCGGLTSIDMPYNLSYVGRGAFDGTGLYDNQQNWKDDVLYIDNILIKANSSKVIDEYHIAEKTKTIAADAFVGCSQLTVLYLPYSVKYLTAEAFDDCGSLSIRIEDFSQYFSSVDGVLLNVDKTELIRYAKDKICNEYTIPDSVSVIGDSAFKNCTNLKTIIIPEHVSEILPSAFDNTSISNIYYAGTKDNWNNISISEYNDDLTKSPIHCGAVGTNPPKIDKAAFDDLKTSINISLKDIEYDSTLITAFYSNDRLIDLEVTPVYAYDRNKQIRVTDSGFDSVKVFIWGSLEHIDPLCPTVDVPMDGSSDPGSEPEEDKPDNNKLLYSADNNEVIITGCEPYSTDIIIPSEIDGLPVTEIANKAFYENHSLKSVYIEEGVDWIGTSAFYGCDNLVSIHLPDTIERIQDMAFGDCKSLTNITINENSSRFVLNDGVLYDKDMTHLVLAPRNISGSYTVPEWVLVIDSAAFDCCCNLTNINFPDELKVIECMAFGNCTGLTALKIPFQQAFTSCEYVYNDEWYHLIDRTSEIKDSAFYGCSNLKSVIMYTTPYNKEYETDQRGYLYIRARAFNGCASLEEIYLPRDMRIIEEYAFKNCDALKDIYFAGSEDDNITVDSENGNFFNAEMHYNYPAPV